MCLGEGGTLARLLPAVVDESFVLLARAGGDLGRLASFLRPHDSQRRLALVGLHVRQELPQYESERVDVGRLRVRRRLQQNLRRTPAAPAPSAPTLSITSSVRSLAPLRASGERTSSTSPAASWPSVPCSVSRAQSRRLCTSTP